MTADGEDPVAVLTRWEAAGAVWRVVARRGTAVTVALCQCDGGEEAGRLVSADPGLVRYLAGRDSNLVHGEAGGSAGEDEAVPG